MTTKTIDTAKHGYKIADNLLVKGWKILRMNFGIIVFYK